MDNEELETCAVCGKETDELWECVLCGESVCGDCSDVEGDFAMNPGVTVCQNCRDTYPCCADCGLHLPDEAMAECPVCGKPCCSICLEEGRHECPPGETDNAHDEQCGSGPA